MFRKLLGKSENADVDKRLIQEMTEGLTLIGFPTNQSKAMSQTVLKKSKDELIKAGQRNDMYRTGDGEHLLLSQDAYIREHLEACKKHGATDEDIRNWHNLCQLEQSFLLNQDVLIAASLYETEQARGKTKAEAREAVKRSFAKYATLAAEIGEEPSEDSLPVELKLRINKYRLSLIQNHPEKFRRELEEAESFNKWVRSKISLGEL